MALRRRGRENRQIAVIGLGRFGSSVASTLYQMGHEVLAVDEDEEKVQALANTVTHAVQADATDENAMRALGIRNFDVAVVSIGDIEASILTTLVLKGLGVRHVVAKALSDLHGRVLDKVGADRVIFPERDMGARVAHNIVAGNIIDYIELIPGFSIMEAVAKDAFVGRTLKEIEFRAKYGINIVAIKRGDEVVATPGANDVIQAGDILVAVGPDSQLEKLEDSRAES